MANVPNFDDLDQYFLGALNFELEPSTQPAGPEVPRTGAALLQGKSPRAITDRLTDGDPLELIARTKRRVTWHAILMDNMRVAVRAVAYIAYFAARDGYRGDPPLEQFLHKGIDEAITSIIEEDWSNQRKDAPIDPRHDPYASITAAAGIDPADARKVTLEFNLLPVPKRRPLYAVLIQNQSIQQTAETYGLAVAELKSELRTILGRLTGTVEEDLLDALVRQLVEDGHE